jgi:hypothetical protein
VDAMINFLSHVDWSEKFFVNDIDVYVAIFYDFLNDCFESYVPKFVAGGSNSKYPWFDRELRNLDNNKTKAHKFMKEISKNNVRPISNPAQTAYDTTSSKFRDLRCDFKVLHRLKYQEYIENVESGNKTNPRNFLKFADMKRNSTG